MGLSKYFKAAFLNRWNMLAFLGGMGFAALSGQFEVIAALVLAGEVSYLALLAPHPKFQKAVDAQDAQVRRQDGAEAVQSTASRIMKELPKPLLRRFEDLRSRCAELRQISARMREPVQAGDPPPLDDVQLASLDRLLWMYLRLLYTQYALTQFLQKTNETEIQSNINLLDERLKNLSPNSIDDKEPRIYDDRQQRIYKVVEDNLQTSRSRLANYRKAQENHELMGLEIDRLENTIQSLSELAVNRQEPNFISGQIDQVAASMVQTEKTMGELQFVTGLHAADDDVPPILRGTVAAHE
jgi:hypothetical protein